MPCGTFVVTGILSNQVGAVEAEFQLDSPQSVTKAQQVDGTWTVTAVFGPCPDGSNPTSTTPHS